MEILNKKKLIFLMLFLVSLDQITKSWALKNIFKNENIIEVNNFLNFIPVWNKGISFGLLSDLININFFMIIVSSTIALFFFIWFIKTQNNKLIISLTFIISGALGNIIDRFNHKAVVDFIDVHINNLHCPTFNLADSYITLGAFIYIIAIFTSQKDNIA